MLRIAIIVFVLAGCFTASGCVAGTTRLVVKTTHDNVDYRLEYDISR
jgi:hypothetical protein